jgi:hypothetical protein
MKTGGRGLLVFLQVRQTWDGFSGPGTFTRFPSTPNINVGSDVKRIPGDFNHDGKTDIAVFGGGLPTISIAFSDGLSDGAVKFHVTSFPAPDFSGWASIANVKITPGDFNGDGNTDIALTGGAGWTSIPVAFSNGDGTFNVTNAPSPDFAFWATAPGVRVISGHFDAGHRNRTGLALVGASGSAGWHTIPLATSNGDGTFNVSNNEVGDFARWSASAKIVPSDFSYDGLTDFALTGVPGWTTIPLARSTGDGHWTITNSSSPTFASWASAPNVTAVAASSTILLVGAAGWHTLPRAFSIGTGDFAIDNPQNPDTRRFAYWAQVNTSPGDVDAYRTDNKIVSTLKHGFAAGDCDEWAQGDRPGGQIRDDNSSITLTLQDTSGTVGVRWQTDLSTNSSSSGDVWHAHFTFANDAGSPLATVSFDGPDMNPSFEAIPNMYHVDRSATIHVDPAQFNAITNSAWTASC